MNIYVYENTALSKFYPLSSTKASFEFRISSDTFLDRIKRTFSDCKINLFVREELRDIVSHRHPDLEVNPKNKSESSFFICFNQRVIFLLDICFVFNLRKKDSSICISYPNP